MGWNFLGTDWHLFGKLADVALLTLLFAATVMFFYIQRLRKQPQLSWHLRRRLNLGDRMWLIQSYNPHARLSQHSMRSGWCMT